LRASQVLWVFLLIVLVKSFLCILSMYSGAPCAFLINCPLLIKKKKLICIGAAESMKNAKIKSIFIPCYMKY
jgi:hypothetical protein